MTPSFSTIFISMQEDPHAAKRQCIQPPEYTVTIIIDEKTKTPVEEWKVDGKLHREGDLPARIYQDGTREEYYINGKLHRDNDQPAIIFKNWWFCWYQNGEIHRDGDKPAIITDNGRREAWYQHDKLHRENDKPALIHRGLVTEWHQHGNLHRDGNRPAVIFAYGKLEWWLQGVRYMPQENEHITWTVSEEATTIPQDAVCIITLEPITQGSEYCKCDTCNQLISHASIIQWLNTKLTCPHCRAPWTNFIVYK